MSLLIQQLISGMSTGLIYASLALALVFVYQTTGALNFAQGEFAMLSTYLCWSLMQRGMSFPIALVITLSASFLFGCFIYFGVVRPFQRQAVIIVEIVTVGLIMISNSIASFLFTDEIRSFPSPFSDNPISITSDIAVGSHEIGTIGVLFLVLILMSAFLKKTKVGLALRGVAENPVSAELLGYSTNKNLAIGWGVATFVGGISGVLVAHVIFLTPHMMSGVLIYSFAAATLGGMSSPIGAVVGGLIIGASENLMGTFLPKFGSDLKMSLAFLLIVCILLFRPTGLFGVQKVYRV